MKYIYLIICILCLDELFAQNQRFSVKPNPNIISFIPDMTDHKAHGVIKNMTSGTINVLWIREILELPVDWSTFVCDGNLCYSPDLGKCPEKYPNVIKTNDSTVLDVYIRDNGSEGAAHIVMWVFEKEDTSKKLKVDYLFNKIVSNNEVKNIEIKVYPNPAYNDFFVDYNQGLTRIDLYSILGKRVISFEALQRKSYDISPLMDGLYLIKLIGPNEQLLRTIRIQKGSYRP
ncbi:MAG: T9SS type A sorting domain-containing protein [Saprospiraceae bacterium]|nr:T9SS type A sorting domain-containing protein [Candidatus Vicinibacter affinis]